MYKTSPKVGDLTSNLSPGIIFSQRKCFSENLLTNITLNLEAQDWNFFLTNFF